MLKYQYRMEDDGDEDKYDAKTEWSVDHPGNIAQNAAEDFYDNHDGWDVSWPRTIEVYVEGKSIGEFKVELNFIPSFSTSG